MRSYILLVATGAGPFLLLPLLDLAPDWVLLGAPVMAGLLFPVAAVLTEPVNELTGLARRLQAGELKARAVLEPGSELAQIAGVMSGLAERLDTVTRSLEQEVAARTAALSRKADQLRAVGQVGQQVASVLEPEALLHFVVRVMRGTFGYDLAAVLQRHGDHLVLAACAARGIEEMPLGRVLPLSSIPLSEADAPHIALVPALNAQSQMAIPIRLGERVLGAMLVQSLQSNAFDSEDRFTVRTIAGQVAAALENARLFEAERQLRDLAVTEERNRMAREIHDTLAQGFMGVIMQLRAMQTAGDEHTARYHREAAEALARESLQEARRSVWDLRPRPLEGKGLAGALADEVANLERRAALAGSFETEGQVGELPPAVEAALLRIAQEAIHNTIKYARASRLTVRLVPTGGGVELTVADDGVGFDPDRLATAQPDGGFGLGAMAERARLLGGELSVHAAPGAGCRVVARIPVRGRA